MPTSLHAEFPHAPRLRVVRTERVEASRAYAKRNFVPGHSLRFFIARSHRPAAY